MKHTYLKCISCGTEHTYPYHIIFISIHFPCKGCGKLGKIGELWEKYER